MTTDTGLYIHIPFCVRKCNYCDFCSVGSPSSELVDGYVNSLIKEIRSYREAERIAVSTVFFGGGTPSLLGIEQISLSMDSVREVFDLTCCTEITLKVNPGTASQEKLCAWRSMGINRLSIGLQSVHENELKKLGRIHSFEDFLTTFKNARNAGFDKLNVDLMYGIPYQTKESFKKTLDTVVSLSPEHISAYGLIVEEGTPFYNEGSSLEVVSSDEECDMYELCDKLLTSCGYRHYEISNYAKPGMECRHNLLYWRDMEYVGVGASAYSYFRGVRYGNSRDISAYVKSPLSSREYTECIDKSGEAVEYAMMRLRLAEGISLKDYSERFGSDFLLGKEELVKRLACEGLAILDGNRLALTSKGMYVSNSIISSLI